MSSVIPNIGRISVDLVQFSLSINLLDIFSPHIIPEKTKILSFLVRHILGYRLHSTILYFYYIYMQYCVPESSVSPCLSLYGLVCVVNILLCLRSTFIVFYILYSKGKGYEILQGNVEHYICMCKRLLENILIFDKNKYMATDSFTHMDPYGPMTIDRFRKKIFFPF